MITVAMSTTVSADRGRVWRALTEPAEQIRWDESLVTLLESSDDRPTPGRSARWRYRLGATTVIMRNELLEVIPGEFLRSATAIGLFRFDESYSLTTEVADVDRTRLHHKLVAANSVPVVGGLLDRFAVRKIAAGIVDTKLRCLQKWCENPS